jgi:hypothetical protein
MQLSIMLLSPEKIAPCGDCIKPDPDQFGKLIPFPQKIKAHSPSVTVVKIGKQGYFNELTHHYLTWLGL